MTIDSLVREFHEAMGVPVVERPSIPSDERIRLRASLIAEEFFETMQSMFDDALLDQARDAIEALIYTKPTVDLAQLAEVHAANMRKVDGPIREDGKRLKPPGWVGPDIDGVMRKSGWEP